MLSRVDFLIVTEEPPAFCWPETSLRVVPDKYETNAGIIGRMQGEKNEPAPASADTRMLASTNSRGSSPISLLSFFPDLHQITTIYGKRFHVVTFYDINCIYSAAFGGCFTPSGHTVTFRRAIRPPSSAMCITTKYGSKSSAYSFAIAKYP